MKMKFDEEKSNDYFVLLLAMRRKKVQVTDLNLLGILLKQK